MRHDLFLAFVIVGKQWATLELSDKVRLISFLLTARSSASLVQLVFFSLIELKVITIRHKRIRPLESARIETSSGRQWTEGKKGGGGGQY